MDQTEADLKRGARARRRARSLTGHRTPIRIGAFIPYIGTTLLLVGAYLTFFAPDPTGTRYYRSSEVFAQIDRRNGEKVGNGSYFFAGADPFRGDRHLLTIANDYYYATVATPALFDFRDGAIYPKKGGKTRFLGLERRPLQPSGDLEAARYLPDILRSMVNAPIIEGHGVNIEAAARKFISDAPIFYVPEKDLVLFEAGSVERVEALPRGFKVTYSDGISITDMVCFAIMLAGLVMTLRVVL